MAPVPKRKLSKGRRDRRRSHYYAMALTTLVVCPQCKEAKLPHRACPNCGTYRGRQVIDLDKKEKKSKK